MLTFYITHPDAHQSQLNDEFAGQCSYTNKRDRRNIAEQLQSTIQSRKHKLDKQFQRALINANFKTKQSRFLLEEWSSETILISKN